MLAFERGISRPGAIDVGRVAPALGDQRLGHQHEAGDRRGVLERHAHDLGGVDDPRLDQILVRLCGGVESKAARTGVCSRT